MAENQGIHRAVGGGEQCWPGDDIAGPDHHCVEWQANARVATAQFLDFHAAAARSHQALADQATNARRSEESRVGREWVSTWRAGGSPYHYKKNDKYV